MKAVNPRLSISLKNYPYILLSVKRRLKRVTTFYFLLPALMLFFFVKNAVMKSINYKWGRRWTVCVSPIRVPSQERNTFQHRLAHMLQECTRPTSSSCKSARCLWRYHSRWEMEWQLLMCSKSNVSAAEEQKNGLAVNCHPIWKRKVLAD